MDLTKLKIGDVVVRQDGVRCKITAIDKATYPSPNLALIIKAEPRLYPPESLSGYALSGRINLASRRDYDIVRIVNQSIRKITHKGLNKFIKASA